MMKAGIWVRACALLVPLALAAPASATDGPSPAGSVRLSNERTLSRWAYPDFPTPIRTLPIATSKQIARLRYRTEVGLAEVYLVLRRWTDPDGRDWLQIRIPKRPNGQKGWVPDSALGPLHLVRTLLVVDRRDLRATLYRSGRSIWRSPIGIGTVSSPTPAGRYWIRERIVLPDPSGTYGPIAFGTSAYSRLSDWPRGGVVGIHGTNQPELIPGRPSHGCIRIPNEAISRLADLMPIGTPVQIR